jgi:hypothetical protein
VVCELVVNEVGESGLRSVQVRVQSQGLEWFEMAEMAVGDWNVSKE